MNEKLPGNSDFDYQQLLARADNDRQLLHELLMIFKEEFPRHLQAVRDAVRSEDAKLVATTAHTLKGMLLNMAAGQTSAAAARLEQLGRDGERSGFPSALADLEKDAASLMPQINAFMAEVHQ